MNLKTQTRESDFANELRSAMQRSGNIRSLYKLRVYLPVPLSRCGGIQEDRFSYGRLGRYNRLLIWPSDKSTTVIVSSQRGRKLRKSLCASPLGSYHPRSESFPSRRVGLLPAALQIKARGSLYVEHLGDPRGSEVMRVYEEMLKVSQLGYSNL